MIILKVSLRNFSAYKKHYFKLICAFIALMFLITLFTIFSIAATDKYTEIKNRTVSSNYSLSSVELENDKISCDFHSEKIQKVDIASRSEELFGHAFDYISTCRIALIIDENAYQSRQDIFVSLYSSNEWNIFTDNDYAEYGLHETEQFLIGKFPSSGNEIVLSQEFIDCFNLTKDIIGQRIQIVSNNDQECVILKDMVICGILTKEYSTLTGHSNSIIRFSPSILVSADNTQINRYKQTDLYITSFSDWLSSSDMEYLTSIKAGYVGINSISQIGYVNNLQMVNKQIVLYVGISLICGIILTIFLLLEKISTATEKNSAMLLSVGANNRQLLYIFLVQIAIANLTALAISYPVSIGVFGIINSALSYSLNLRLSVSGFLFLKVMSIGFCCIAGITLATSFYIHIKIKNKQIRDLM